MFAETNYALASRRGRPPCLPKTRATTGGCPYKTLRTQCTASQGTINLIVCRSQIFENSFHKQRRV